MIAAGDVSIQVTGHFLGHGGQRAGFVLLAGFLGSWLFIRTSARLIRSPRVSWWPGSVETQGGLHIHHLVWGICTVLITGFLSFALRPHSPWLEILAGLFGIGTGLTLDEFALWLRLQDVYWSNEGRESIDAVLVAAVFAAMVVVGVAPFDVSDTGSILTIVAAAAIHVSYCAVCATKGKGLLTLTGAFIPLIALVGAIRLAKPGSPWARRRYPEQSRKLERARARSARVKERRTRFFNLIAGAPSEPDPAPAPEPQPKA
ncbi:MAG: hypothetical protein M3155_01050 [Actinomycetota bacterium]|nr:hypothetical protein [Actinomycetota bacterium]